MNAEFAELIQTHVVDPAGWMLIHSIWQAACLAAVAAVLVRVLKNRSPELRYGLLTLLLVAITSAPLITFWWASPSHVSTANQTSLLSSKHLNVPGTSTFDTPVGTVQTEASMVPGYSEVNRPIMADMEGDNPETPTLQLRSIFPWLVGIWIAGVVLLSMWNLSGWIAVGRLLRLGIEPVAKEVQAAVTSLSAKVGIQKKIAIWQSAVVDVPSVIGWIRPTILLPASVLTGLRPDQIEAILAHELAHIRRVDYLVNLMQTVVETLFFYHPGVWYVSSRMRIEREYAADRTATAIIGSPTAYARALASLEEIRPVSRAVLAATGGNLLQRIRLLLGLETNDAGRTASWLLGAISSVVAVSALTFIPVVQAKLDETRAPRVAMQRVWADAVTELSGRVAPDGRHVAYVNWHNGNVAVHNLETGQNKELTTEGTWDRPNRWAQQPIWHADSKQIVFAWFVGNTPSELRIVSLDGDSPQTIYEADAGGSVYPLDWSPDGKEVLAFTRDAEGRTATSLINVEGGSLETLDNIPGNIDSSAFSPDGSSIAFSHSSSEQSQHDIYLCDLNSGKVTPLVHHPADDNSPVWSPDGRWLSFLSTRGGTRAAWMIGIEDGRPTGEIQRLSSDLPGAHALGFTSSGEYFVGLDAAENNIFVVDFDPENHRSHGEVRPLVRLFEGRNGVPKWSPDGEKLAFISSRPSGRGGQQHLVVVREEQTGKERAMDVRLGKMPLTRIAWLPDSESLLVGTVPPDVEGRRPTIFTCDVSTGATQPLITWNRHDPGQRTVSTGFAVSPDGQHLYYGSRGDSKVNVVRRQLAGGDEIVVATVSNIALPHSMSVSSDGRYLALAGFLAIELIDLQANTNRRLFQASRQHTSILRGLTWSGDNQHLVFSEYDATKSIRCTLWRIAVGGEKPQPLGVEMPHIEYPMVHPIGRQIAFEGRKTRHSAEVWSIRHSLLVNQE